MHSLRPSLATAVVFAALLTACDASCAARPAVAARPSVLVFGGGWGPEGTQASIEAHVHALEDALQSRKPTVLFAAGPDQKLRAVQEVAPVDEASAILGAIFDRNADLHVRYRPTKLTPTKRANKVALLTAIERLAKGAPLVVFGAGHGAAATEIDPAQIELWGPDDRVGAKDLVEAIARAEPRAPVALVFGHCHAGAMYDVVFEAADPRKPVATPARCLLAAVPADREAAGCTADVGDPSAPAYLAQIATALTSKKVADYDKDGRIGLHEAHTFAIIGDPTVDVPVRSSDLYVESVLGADAPDPADYSMESIQKNAPPARRAALDKTLPSNLAKATPAAIAGALAAIDERIKITTKEVEAALDAKEKSRRVLLDEVLAQWPELANPYHHRARELLAGDAKVVIKFVKQRPAYKALVSKSAIVGEIDRTLLQLDKRGARIERWLRTAQFVLSERAVRKRNDPKVVTALDALLQCERLAP